MSSRTSTGFKGLHQFDNSSSETERMTVSASGHVYSRCKTGQEAVVCHNSTPNFRFYTFKTSTWKSASILKKVPFDTVIGVWGSMAPTNVKAASLAARKPGVPTYIQGWRVTANVSSSDNSATIAVIGRMQNGARASCAAGKRCVMRIVVCGF
jgi:hypothetical protein